MNKKITAYCISLIITTFIYNTVLANDFLTPIINVGCVLSSLHEGGDQTLGWGYSGEVGIINDNRYYGMQYSQNFEYSAYSGYNKENKIRVFDLLYGLGKIEKSLLSSITTGLSILYFDTDKSNTTTVGIPCVLTLGPKVANIGAALKVFGYLTPKGTFGGASIVFILDPTQY